MKNCKKITHPRVSWMGILNYMKGLEARKSILRSQSPIPLNYLDSVKSASITSSPLPPEEAPPSEGSEGAPVAEAPPPAC